MTDEERARSRMWAAIVAAVNTQIMTGVDEAVEAFETAIRADEREKCAQVAIRHDTGDMQREDMEARRIASAIRAVGDKP